MAKWFERENRIDVDYIGSRRFITVEHPGTISNCDKALKTLGGIKQIEQIYSEKNKRLPLCWRPDDMYCKPTYGDRVTISSMLMKVRKRTRKSDGKVEFCIQVLGVTDTTYRFQSMCDFQYLPMQKMAGNTYENIYDKVVIKELTPFKEYMARKVPLFIPPLLFSRVDRPCDQSYMYRQDTIHRRPEYKDPDKERPANYIGTVRQRRTIFTIFVNFGETIPTNPMPEAVERMHADFVDKAGEVILIELFDKKPLYLKTEIEHKSGISSVRLKTYLPAMCFYWLDGPWRGQWNKFGFDPTLDTSAKIHQTIDFRIRQVKPGQVSVKAKRDQVKHTQWNQVNRNQKQNVKINLDAFDEGLEDTRTAEETELEKELLYKFKPGCIPPQRMMYYPVCYVEVDEVQQLLHSNDGQETKCTEKDGWCVEHFNDRCRDLMYQFVNKLLFSNHTVEYKFWRTKKKKRVVEILDHMQAQSASRSAAAREHAMRAGQEPDDKQVMSDTYGEQTATNKGSHTEDSMEVDS